jgi:hypothetical protein
MNRGHVFLQSFNSVADESAGWAQEAGQLKPTDWSVDAKRRGRSVRGNGDSVFVVLVFAVIS